MVALIDNHMMLHDARKQLNKYRSEFLLSEGIFENSAGLSNSFYFKTSIYNTVLMFNGTIQTG